MQVRMLSEIRLCLFDPAGAAAKLPSAIKVVVEYFQNKLWQTKNTK